MYCCTCNGLAAADQVANTHHIAQPSPTTVISILLPAECFMVCLVVSNELPRHDISVFSGDRPYFSAHEAIS